MNRALSGKLIISVAACLIASGCVGSGGGLQTPEIATSLLSTPGPFLLSGPGTAVVGNNIYFLADSTGAISGAANTLSSTVPDPALPLELVSPGYAFYDQMVTGNCNLDPPYSSISGGNGNSVTTQIDATGCLDQSTIAVTLDTSQLLDAAGDIGYTLATSNFLVDLAPTIVTPAAGNTLADGTGVTEGSAGVYKVATDNSIVATFSKSLTGGTLAATLTGSLAAPCSAAIATTALVSGPAGTTIVWTVTGATATQTCTLNVSGITDAIGNPYDPFSANLAMPIAFQ